MASTIVSTSPLPRTVVVDDMKPTSAVRSMDVSTSAATTEVEDSERHYSDSSEPCSPKSPSLKHKFIEAVLRKTYNPFSLRLEDHYQLGSLLGTGNYGQVYAARLRIKSHTYGQVVGKAGAASPDSDGGDSPARRAAKGGDSWVSGVRDAPFACKIMHKQGADEAKVADLNAELILLENCQHENVMQLVEKFETHERVYAVFVRCYGDLEKFQEKANQLPLDLCHKWVLQLCSALAHCHSCGIVHRDVKKTNLLFQGKGPEPDIVLGDFGFACRIEDAGKKVLGTPLLLSPEVMHGAEQGFSCDAWAAGLTVYEMITGQHPFRFIFDSRRMASEVEEIIEATPELDTPKLAEFREIGKKFGTSETFIDKFQELAILATSEKFRIPLGTSRMAEAPLLRDVVQQLLCRNVQCRATMAEAVALQGC